MVHDLLRYFLLLSNINPYFSHSVQCGNHLKTMKNHNIFQIEKAPPHFSIFPQWQFFNHVSKNFKVPLLRILNISTSKYFFLFYQKQLFFGTIFMQTGQIFINFWILIKQRLYNRELQITLLQDYNQGETEIRKTFVMKVSTKRQK